MLVISSCQLPALNDAVAVIQRGCFHLGPQPGALIATVTAAARWTRIAQREDLAVWRGAPEGTRRWWVVEGKITPILGGRGMLERMSPAQNWSGARMGHAEVAPVVAQAAATVVCRSRPAVAEYALDRPTNAPWVPPMPSRAISRLQRARPPGPDDPSDRPHHLRTAPSCWRSG